MGGLHAKDAHDRDNKTGSTFRWKPDLEVFTDIAIPVEYYTGRDEAPGGGQSPGSPSCFRNQVRLGKFEDDGLPV